MAERSDFQEKDKWQLEHIIEEKDWEKTCKEISARIDRIGRFKGTLGTIEGVCAYFKEDEELSDEMMKVYAYAKMRHDEDSRSAKYTSMSDKAESLIAKSSASTAFVLPELTALSDETLREYAESPRLKDYDYFFKNMIRNKKHILSEKEERLLAGMSEISGGYSDVFEMLDNADLNLPEITVGKEKQKLTHARYSLLMQSEDREIRKKTFEAYYTAYRNLIHAIGVAYHYNVKKDWFYAKARGYDSCLQRALEGEDVTPDVYENLLESVNANLKSLHEYIDYKKAALKVKDFYMYDMYVPTVEGGKLELEYDKAYELVKKGLSCLGEDYGKLLGEAYRGGWVDVYENEGKRSGAYSFGVRTCHPFVLLNYEKTTHDVFTIAHELGHAMHSYYSNAAQPAAKADYAIFVAEVASTVNEVLLLRYLAASTQDKKLKKYLLYYFLEMFRTTLFRQTQFAEFEYVAHKMVEDGQPLTFENLSEVYLRLNDKYYGKALSPDGMIQYEWARIPHFYRSFYVYKYATGIISAVTIADGILSGDKQKIVQYKEFLKSGGSDSPVELLKIAGVDLTKKQPFEAAMNVFRQTLKELKNS